MIWLDWKPQTSWEMTYYTNHKRFNFKSWVVNISKHVLNLVGSQARYSLTKIGVQLALRLDKKIA